MAEETQEQTKPENKYQTYLHKLISRLNDRQITPDNMDWVWYRIFKSRVTMATKMAIRYSGVDGESDDEIKQFNKKIEDIHTSSRVSADPLSVKLEQIKEAYGRLEDQTEEEIRDAKKKTSRIPLHAIRLGPPRYSGKIIGEILDTITCQLGERQLSESTYNYILNNTPKTILLRLRMEVEARGFNLEEDDSKFKDYEGLIKKLK